MASSINKKNTKRAKKMSTADLKATIEKLEPLVREQSSLLECAKWEYRKRLLKQQRQEIESKEE